MSSPYDRSPEDIEAFQQAAAKAIELLESVLEDRGLLADLDKAQRQRLLMAAGRVSKPDKKARKRLARTHRRRDKTKSRDNEEALLAQTGIRAMRDNPIFLTPRRRLLHGESEPEKIASEPIGEVKEERTCYVCRKKYTAIHYFYDQMCVECGDFNFAKRDRTATSRAVSPW